MRPPIYVEPVQTASTSPINLPIFLTGKSSKITDANSIDKVFTISQSPRTTTTTTSSNSSNNKSKKSTLRLTKTTTTRTTTTTLTNNINQPKPISLVIKNDLSSNDENREDKSKNNNFDDDDDLVETFEITEKNPSTHRKFPKPPIIAYANNNLTNQNNTENKSNFRTRRNSIILNLDKYVVNNNNNNNNTRTNSENKTKTKMVNIPLTPKKYHTFNENESPSHKEIKNKIVLTNEQDNKTDNGTATTNKQIYITKPIKRTGSNLNTGINNIQKPLARRPPKEFLSATITPSDSNDFKLTNTRTTSRDSFNQNKKEEIFTNDYSNRTISPTMKSLPSYDEALKRVTTSDTNHNKISKVITHNNQTKNFAPAVTSKSIETNGSYVPTIYSNVNSTPPVFKNRSTLPNLQSTFKSILVQPANNPMTSNNNLFNNINTTTTNNNGNNISSKVYFRPQDLNSSNRLIQIQNEKSASIHNQDSFKQYNQNEVYIIPKNLNDRNNNNNNHSPIIVANNPLSSSSSSSNPSNNKMVKKLSINVISEESKLNESPPNIIKENTSLPPTPIPVTRQCIEIKPMNTTTNKVIPATTSITTTTSTCNNYISTKTTSSIQTHSTGTSNENINSIKQRTPSPGFQMEKNNIITQVESPTPILINNNLTNSQKVKSWPSFLNSNQNNTNKVTIDQETKNIRERTPSSENRPQSSLANWKSTGTVSTLVSTPSPYPSDGNLNKKSDQIYFDEPIKYSNFNTQVINIKPSNNCKTNDSSYTILSSGKLVDAVKAATIGTNNSVEDGLGLVANNIMPNLIKKNVNSNKTSSILRKSSHVNLGYIEDEVNIQSNNKINQNQQQQQQQQRKVNKNSLEDTFSSSYSSSSSSYNIDSNYKNINSNPKLVNVQNESLDNDQKRDIIISRPISNNNNNNNIISNLASKSSSQTTDTNFNNIFNRNKTKDSTTTVTEHAVTERPPGRLNYYDSDTLSEGFLANNRNLKPNIKELNGIMSDSPNLSDLSEARFDEINGGHRTSTPNMSKQKRSASLSTPEIKHIKKQIQDLEKMYHEILKVIDTEKQSLNSIMNTTSRTSSSSYSSFNHSNKDPNSRKRINTRSSSHRNTNKASDIHYLKHRFNRMESHLTSLAKTVAQISVELKTMKSVEKVILNLKREILEIRNLNSGLSNSNKPNELFRSTSEPHLINSINVKGNDEEVLIKEISCDKLDRNIFSYNNIDSNENSNEKRSRKESLVNDFRSWNSWSSSYTNPLKLKKLTKFFGEEPPMLRLFLQKLNYEIYIPNFENEHITITELPYLSEERLRQIGIPLGPRLRILQEAQASFRNEQIHNYLI